MSKIFSIRWPKLGKAIEAEIIEAQDQALKERFWNALPFSSIQSHAVCAGIQMYCPFRLVCIPSNPFLEPMNEQIIGRINLELDFQYLAINYGLMEEPVPALPIAQVRGQDMDITKLVGKMAWRNLLFSNEFIDVHFEKMERGTD